MPAYILSGDNSTVIGSGQSGNWQDLPNSDSRVVTWLAEQAAAATVGAAVSAAMVAGINLTSTGTPALNGNYSVSNQSVTNIANVQTYILSTGNFPGGGSTMPWMDSSGAHHIFPDVATFKNFAVAFADWVAAVQLYADSGGAIGSIPSNNITIP